MSGTPLWRRYLRFWGPDPGSDVDDEFAFHLEMRIEQLVERGLSPKEARDEAQRGFGDIQRVKQICRTLAEEREQDVKRIEWWADWRHDVRYALRQLTVSPMLTGVLVLTIALGIGSTVAIFSVLNAVLLRPLPFDDSDRIVSVFETWRQFQQGNASVGHFHDWTEEGTVFEHTAASQRATYNLSDGEPERLSGMRATPGFFRVSHIAPTLGRYFTERDLDADPRVVVLGHGLWLQRFAGDTSILGQTIRLNDEAHTVVGVAPPEYAITPFPPQLWTPLVFSPEQRANYGTHAFSINARLKAGVTVEAAQADMERVTRGIAERYPRQMEGRSVNVQRFSDILLGGQFRTGLYVLLTSVLVVLLIGCVNVASLLLARAATRRREIAIRSAIGGGRWRIVRQLLTESVVLALAGGSAGIGLAYVGIHLFVTFGPREIPRLQDAGLQTEVLLFAVGVTLITGLVFGLAPALRAARENLLMTLREGGRSSLPAAARDRLRSVLVVAEIAAAVVLVIGAGLLIRSAWRLQQVPLGFDISRVLTARVALPAERYGSDETVSETYRRMLEEMRATPGIEHAGASTGIPLVGGGPDAGVRFEGQPWAPGTAPSPAVRLVTEGYLEAIGMPLRRGRTLNASDMAPGGAPVVVINETLASLGWPGESPIGKRLSAWTATLEPEWREVVGVVGDVRSGGPDDPPRPELFYPYTQPPVEAWDVFQRSMALVVRTDDDPAAYAPAVRRAVRSVDASLPLYQVLTMNEALGIVLDGTRFSTWLLTLLAGAGLVLAAVGIYGVIAYFVTQRTPEIGLRLALGASPLSVLLMVVRHGVALAVAGIAVGLVVALAVTRMLAALLFEISATDVPSYAAGAAFLLTIALLACAGPALRAVRVDPIRSLAGD